MWNRKAGRGLSIAAAMLAVAAICPVARGEPAAGGGAWIGVSVQALNAGWRERENYWARGVMVSEAAAGGPAARAGITAGDVLESIDSHPLQSPADVTAAEGGLVPGRAVEVVVARSGGRMIKIFTIEPDPVPAAQGDVPTPASPGAAAAGGGVPAAAAQGATPGAAAGVAAVEATAGAGAAAASGASASPGAPEAAASAAGEPDAASATADVTTAAVALGTAAAVDAVAGYDSAAGGARTAESHAGVTDLGVRCENLSFDLAEALGAAEGQGVLVLSVSTASRADKAGMRPGDVISWVGGKPVMDVAHLDEAVAAANGAVAVVTRRGGTTRNVMVEFEEDGGAAPTESDPLLQSLLEEVRSLREEVQKLRNEIAHLARASNVREP
jgi:membrane-associated protease RseP (regulator of RpoE activity)